MNNVSHPLVSIIVPVYNSQKYLEQCISSLVNQSYKNIEIVLVNDGSTDNSLEICNTLAMHDSRIKVIIQANLGVYEARLNGLRQSSGEFIMFVDSDDYVSVEIVTLLYQTIKDYNVDMVSCQYYDVIDDKVLPTIIKPNIGYYNRDRIEELLKYKFLHDSRLNMSGMTGYLWGRLFRRYYMEQALKAGKGLIYSEDQVSLFAYLYHINTMYVIKDSLYYYVHHKNQTTKSYRTEYWENFELYFERLVSLDKKAYLRRQIFNRALSMLRHLIKMEFERPNAIFFKQYRMCKNKFSNKLFLLAKHSDSIGLNRKEKIQRILILYKQIFLYGLLLYLNRGIKFIDKYKSKKE